MAARALAAAPARAAEPGSTNRVQTARQAAKTAAPRGGAAISARGASSGVVNISSSLFEPSQAVAEEIEKAGPRGLDVRVIAKGLTEEGVIKVRQDRGKTYDSLGPGTMPLLNPWTQKLGGMYLNFEIDNSAIKDGYASFKPRGGDRNGWLEALRMNSALLGGLGLKIESLPKPVNKFEQGKLMLGVSGIKVVVGGYVDAKFDLLVENMAAPKISGSADIDVRGVAKGTLAFDNPGDVLRGSVSLAVNFKSFSGAVKVAYLSDGSVDISGSAAYNANKLSGEIQFVSTDLDSANKFAKDAIAAAGGLDNVQNAGPPSPVPVAKEGKKQRALAATGKLSFNLTTWFAGTVQVVVDGKGDITVIGKIAPPGEIILFPERAWNKQLVKFEAKAYYGIPVVGNLNLFANISLSAIAKLGPARLYAIEILGTYSTDPTVQKNIQIAASLNISAYGGLRLTAQGGAGIEILAHDLKFGIGLNADVGVKAYADARPTIGYRDPGIFYVSGTLDLVAQPILALGGEFFIELDAPWFSPLSDDRWSWPLFSKEWPLGEPIGLSATLKDYVLGSGKVPEIELKAPEFDPTKFMTTMVDDKLPKKSGGAGAGGGTFKEDGSVTKPAIKSKKGGTKSDTSKTKKKGDKASLGKSSKADSKVANEAKSTEILKKAAPPLAALKGKGPLTRGSLDQELGKIRRQVSGIDFGSRLNGAKWLVSPKAGPITGRGLEIAAKSESAENAQKASGSGLSRLIDWWKEKRAFTNKAGEKHTLQFIGTGPEAKFGIASTLTPIETYLAEHSENGKPNWVAASSAYTAAKTIVFSTAKKTDKEKADRKKIQDAMANMGAAFANLAGADPTDEDYGKTTPIRTGMAAGYDVIVGKAPGGGTDTDKKWPTDAAVGGQHWLDIAEAGLTTIADKWVRMHIVSAQLGGKGSDYSNLIPAPNSVNTGPFGRFEQACVKLPEGKVGKLKNRVWIDITVSGSMAAPTGIAGKAGIYLWKGKKLKWEKETAKPALTVSAGIPAIPKKGEARKFLINFVGKTEMQAKPINLPRNTAVKVYENRSYGSDAEVKTKLAAVLTEKEIAFVIGKGPVYDRS